MNYREETFVLKTLKKIRDETNENNRLLKENNIMLKALCKYFSNIAVNASNENISDFGRNLLANLISTNFEMFNPKRK